MADEKVVGGIFFLFIGFYVMLQKVNGALFVGLAMMAIGLYLLLKYIK